MSVSASGEGRSRLRPKRLVRCCVPGALWFGKRPPHGATAVCRGEGVFRALRHRPSLWFDNTAGSGAVSAAADMTSSADRKWTWLASCCGCAAVEHFRRHRFRCWAGWWRRVQADRQRRATTSISSRHVIILAPRNSANRPPT